MTYTTQESFGYQLSDFKDRSDRWFSSLECRKLDFSSSTRLITRVEIQNSLSKCPCGTLRKRFTSSVANAFSCEIQSPDKLGSRRASGQDEELQRVRARLARVVQRSRAAQANSKAPPLATPTDAKGNDGKEKPGTSDGVADANNPGNQSTPQPSSSQSPDEASPVFWALLFFVVVLILGLALVLLIHYSRRNPGARLPLLGLDPDEADHQQIWRESTPSSNAQTGHAQGVFNTGRTVTTDPVGAAEERSCSPGLSLAAAATIAQPVTFLLALAQSLSDQSVERLDLQADSLAGGGCNAQIGDQ